MRARVLALDGHDGAGKTSLARHLAESVGAEYASPFSGRVGAALMHAYRRNDHAEVIAIGLSALLEALSRVPKDRGLILDRSWITVGTLVPVEFFRHQWTLWIPTVLLWCDREETLSRLKLRVEEDAEPAAWHDHFLSCYLDRSRLSAVRILRTDQNDAPECIAQLTKIFGNTEPFDF